MNRKRLLTMVLVSAVLTPSYVPLSFAVVNDTGSSAGQVTYSLPAVVAQAVNSLKNATTNAEKETALAGLINAITAAVKETPESAADIVGAAVAALPDYAGEIVTAAIEGAFDYAPEIVTAAINAGADSGVVTIAARTSGVDSTADTTPVLQGTAESSQVVMIQAIADGDNASLQKGKTVSPSLPI